MLNVGPLGMSCHVFSPLSQFDNILAYAKKCLQQPGNRHPALKQDLQHRNRRRLQLMLIDASEVLDLALNLLVSLSR